MGRAIISSPAALGCDALTDILSSCGLLREASVQSIAYEPIGNGLLGDSIRFHIEYDRMEEAAPKTLAGKFPVSDPGAREASQSSGIYLNEVNFYRQIAPTVKVAAPRVLYAEIDSATMEFGLLMEDLAPARGGNQLVPATLEEVYLGIDQLAALHGPLWNASHLKQLDWLGSMRSYTRQIVPRMQGVMEIFHERHGDVLEPEHMEICDRYAARIGEFALREPPTWTVAHKDFRLDNMLFDAKAGAVPLAVLDWQTVACDSGLVDLAYFIGLCTAQDMRRQRERAFFDYYLDRLASHGLTGIDPDALWREYRIGAHHGVYTAILGSCFAKRTPRGDRMFMAMARGACAQMRDLDSLSAL